MLKNKRLLLACLYLGLIPVLSGCETPYELCGKIENRTHPQCAGNHAPEILQKTK